MNVLFKTQYTFAVQVSSSIVNFPKQTPPTLILSSHNIPSKVDWDLAVNRALQMIERNDSLLTKVTYISCTFLLSIFSFLFKLLYNDSCFKSPYENSSSYAILETQVVLARSTRVVPTSDIDPLAWLSCLKVLFLSFLFCPKQSEHCLSSYYLVAIFLMFPSNYYRLKVKMRISFCFSHQMHQHSLETQ